MGIDLSGSKLGVSERFVPDRDRGRLIEAEHIARYQWASQAASGRTVLDAGCGTAYGSAILAEAKASSVIGVDIAEAVLKAAAPTMPDRVRLEAGDVCQLPYEDGSFELVVCFEVIEHLEQPLAALDELVRVLAPSGLLIVSSPNRGVYPDGNPHHVHEFTGEQLREALRTRLKNTRLVRQHDYIASAVLDDAVYERNGGAPMTGVDLHKLVIGVAGNELYTVALASDGPLPEPNGLAVLTSAVELADWIEVSDVQTAAIHDKDNYIGELEARLGERERIAQLLTDAEQRVAGIPDLHARIDDLTRELADERHAHEQTRDRAETLDERLMSSERVLRQVFSSPSWQVTKPLRYAKRRLKG
jgi:2-polyprenyl-3-methyl-5-hydroxy-6-metoxy-1,4-benzoquinol methylase